MRNGTRESKTEYQIRIERRGRRGFLGLFTVHVNFLCSLSLSSFFYKTSIVHVPSNFCCGVVVFSLLFSLGYFPTLCQYVVSLRLVDVKKNKYWYSPFVLFVTRFGIRLKRKTRLKRSLKVILLSLAKLTEDIRTLYVKQ